MIVGVPKETFPGENRIILVQAIIPPLQKAGLEISIEKGASVIDSRTDLLKSVDIVLLYVRVLGAIQKPVRPISTL
ncbi:MAG: hypothetical protein V3W18_14550 [candidate division Zixibacteria bacterium]